MKELLSIILLLIIGGGGLIIGVVGVIAICFLTFIGIQIWRKG